MKSSLGCCAFCLGMGFVVGAGLASNNAKVRNWFMSSTKKMAEMCEDIMKKVDSKISCTCSQGDCKESKNFSVGSLSESEKTKKNN